MPPFRLIATSTLLTLLMLGVLLASATPASASVPLTLPFQGRVLLKDGNPVPDGSYPAVFRLYRGESGGVAVWSEVHEGVVAVRGIVAATLGLKTSLAPVDFSAGEYFLGVEFNNDGEMAPRARLTSLPSALASLTLEGRRASEFLLKKGNQTFEGNLTLSSGNFTTNGSVNGGTFIQGGTSLDNSYLRFGGGTLTGDLTLLQGSGSDLPVGGKSTFTGSATFKATPLFESNSITLGPQTVTNLTATSTIESQGTLTANNGFTLQAGTLSLPASSVTDAMVSNTITLSNYLALAGGTLTGTLRVDAGIGIGVAGSSLAGISIAKTTADSNYYGVYNSLTDLKSEAIPATVYGLRNSITTNFAAGGTGSPTGYGVYTIATGESSDAEISGYYYASAAASTAGTHYAFYADMTQGTATKWGLSIQGVGGNWLANALRIGGSAATPSGNLDIRQIANGDDVIYAKAVGTSGNFITFQNAAGASTPFSISNSGAIVAASLNAGTGSVTAGGTTFTTSTAVPLTVNNSTGANSIFVAQALGAPVFTILDGGNVQIGTLSGLGTTGGGTITIGRTSGSGNATINLNDANATYTFKTNARTLALSPRDCESSSGSPTASNVGDFPSWLLDDAQSDTIRCSFRLPDDWSSGTNLTVKFVHVGTTTESAKNVVFQVQTVPASERDDAAATGSTGSETFALGTYTLNTRKTTSGVSVSAAGSAIAASDVLSLEVARLGSDGSDTYLGNTHLIQILVDYTATTPTNG